MPLFGPPGQRIGYVVHEGRAGAPPLLLLHGFTASAASFVSNLPGLTRRFTVITAELLGHGDSDAPDDPSLYAPGPAIGRLLGLLDALGHEQVLLCGHSLGGALALRIALEAPERVAGLVVLNSNSAAGSPDWRENARAGMREMAAAVRRDGIDSLRRTRLYPARGKRLPEEARLLLTRDFDRLQPAGIAGTAESLVIDVNAFERLGELRVPTLVVIGDRDADFARNAPRFLLHLPEELVDTFTIQGAGHAANLEQPEVFNEALFAFAERAGYLPPASGATGAAGEPGRAGSRVLSDDDLGPSIYEEIRQALRIHPRQVLLGATGTSLIVLGAGLMAAAFLVGGDNRGQRLAAADPATATPTTVDEAAGVRTAGPPTATATAATSAVAGAKPSATTTSAPIPAATAAPPTPTRPAPSPTPLPPTTAPQPTATPTATATPSGPAVFLRGPGSGAAGELLTFSSEEYGAVIRRDWLTSNGASAAHAPTFSVSFPAPGCYLVTVTALFEGGLTREATQAVSIGGSQCH